MDQIESIIPSYENVPILIIINHNEVFTIFSKNFRAEKRFYFYET